MYDLTPLLQEYKGDLLPKPIVEVAGQDISHWFDPDTRDIGKAHRSADRFPEIPHPPGLLSARAASAAPFGLGDFGKPWWQGSRYEVGRLSAKARNTCIINTLTSQEHTPEAELTIGSQTSGYSPKHLDIPPNIWNTN
ncbi:hypothetical protein EI555_006707 [Monodon monoceros]|uniref:Cytochrome b5 heme-binding domain-containing protein n=1 Tax=Monodon monoceros TaxID=40151 RepID=A0A4U1EL12_MONMO|nr:hypothetical protein EI555_006707 [Monodon monoceros]